ncbi:MAG: ABC transporter substrate-binding protein [Acidimicrobiales bacterium]
MRRSRLLRLLAIIFAISLIAAACGDDDDTSASGDDGAASDDGSSDDGSSDDGAASDDGSAPSDDGEEPMDDGEEPMDDVTVPSNEDEGITDDVIKVGWMGDLTGPTASAQSFNSHGSQAYFECLNERGGVLGRQIEFIAEDDQFSLENATVNWTKLTEDDKILALVGMGNSAITTALAPEVEALGIPVIGPPQTIDAQFLGDQFFNNIAHYGDQGDIAAGQIAADVGGLENAVVTGISLEVPSGQEFATYVQASVEAGGGTYTGTLFIAPGASEATAQMVELQQAIDELGTNYVTLHGSPGSALVVLQAMSDAGITDIPVIGIHGVAGNSVFTEGPADVTDQTFGIHSFVTANNDTEGAAEMTRCAALAGYEGEELILNFAHGYLNGYIFEQAILRAAEADGEVTREGLTEALKGQFDTMGLSCPIDWSESQHSPCGAPFQLDPATGGMVQANPFEFYAPQLDGVYGLEFTQ